jgi:hypothetical protein
MEQGLEAGTDREAESGLERFAGGNSLSRVFPNGSRGGILDSRFRGNDELYPLTLEKTPF